MEYTSKEVLLKNGKTCLLRLAEESDAEMLLEYLKATSAQTPYMVREPEEIRTGIEEEVEFIRRKREDPRALYLTAFVDRRLAGSCSFFRVLGTHSDAAPLHGGDFPVPGVLGPGHRDGVNGRDFSRSKSRRV